MTLTEQSWVWVDGVRVQLSQVAEERRADVEVTVKGRRVRPFRFVATVATNPFVVVR